MKCSVISWWRWITAFVPGVSTRFNSCSHSTGADRVIVVAVGFLAQFVAIAHHVDFACGRRHALGNILPPNRALRNAVLPALNSLTTTSRNNSSSCWRLRFSS